MVSAMFEADDGGQEHNETEASDLVAFKRLVCFLEIHLARVVIVHGVLMKRGI